jgi:hypothetical protein
MTPIFVHITSAGAVWISSDVTFSPAGAITQSFRVNPNANNQLLCTLTGSGNASASALAIAVGTSKLSGRQEGKEIT